MKAANPTLSVCEVGAAIGKLWREMGETEKQRYNEDFAIDKVLDTIGERHFAYDHVLYFSTLDLN